MQAARQTVLIIDDTTSIIHMLSVILADICEVVSATNGAEGIALAARDKPDLILLDVLMPGMDGHQVCKALKADPGTRDIPIVFISALGQEADEALGLEIGAIDYITKPISPPIVRARVRNHLELKRQHAILQRLSAIDGLTGIPNRRRLDEQLATEWRLSLRSGEPLALLMLDVDCFKSYNDNLGHGAGDDCLKRIARCLEESLHRPADLLARYGGEEFACVLPATDTPGALAVAEQLRSAVADLGIPHPASSIASVVTISIGAAAVCVTAEENPEVLVRQADLRLYEAKRQGRNRAVA